MGKQAQIYIRGYPRSTSSDELRDHFKQFGSIDDVNMVSAYSFITFDKIEDAQTAVKTMDNTEFQGSKLTVEMAGQRRKTKGPQPDDICRSCGRKGHWKNSCPNRRSSRHRRRSRSSSSESRRSRHKKSRKHRKRRYSSSSDRSSSSSRSSKSRSESVDSRRSSDSPRKRRNNNSSSNNNKESKDNRNSKRNRSVSSDSNSRSRSPDK